MRKPSCASRKVIGIALLASFVPGPSEAQHRNDNWLFAISPLASGGLLNFTAGYPMVDPTGIYQNCEGFGTISDPVGYLAFCAASNQGSFNSTLFDSNMDPMPNGMFPSGAANTTQGSLIVPRPLNPALYDVFYIDSSPSSSKARHMVVDMNLNGGLGDVVTGSMHVFADTLTEKLTGTLHANGQQYWVLMHKRNDSRFLAYALTSSGLDTVPVVSFAGSDHWDPENIAGQMKVSHAGNTIGLCTRWPSGAGGSVPSIVQLFHFDNNTGEVEYWLDLPGHRLTYGCEISPNGCMFYVAGMDTVEHYIDQYDLCADGGDTNSIKSTRTRIYQFPSSSFTGMPSAMATAPDGKIYITHGGLSELAAIDSPDQQGLACGLVWNAIDMAPGSPFYSHCNEIKNYHDSQLSVSVRPVKRPSAVQLSPNPTAATTWLHLASGSDPVRAVVRDALGKRVLEIRLSAFLIQALDVSALASGSYTVAVEGRDGIIGHARLVVER